MTGAILVAVAACAPVPAVERSSAGVDRETRAIILVDARLYARLADRIVRYRDAAQARRGFPIEIAAPAGLDDWSPDRVRQAVIEWRQRAPALEGVLFVGNVKLPSFYKSNNDDLIVRLIPRWYEDLDARFEKQAADGAIDPECSVETWPRCAIGGPVTVPPHDFDTIVRGPAAGPEIWAAFMPVGLASGTVDHEAFAAQLGPYLDKVLRFYAGELPTNGRHYLVMNDRGEDLESVWAAWGGHHLDFYGMAATDPETGDFSTGEECVDGDENHCYTRWPTETYATAEDFIATYDSTPWVDEGWQDGAIFSQHMNAARHDVVEVGVHSGASYSLISTWEARAIERGGLVVALDGCDVGSFRQPGSQSSVDGDVAVEHNVMAGWLYGASSAVAVLGDPFGRYHFANHPTIWKAMKVDGAYLGASHLERLRRSYAEAGDNDDNFRENGMEILMGDPFVDLQGTAGPSCGELARSAGWRAAHCESGGNAACSGRAGAPTWDCDLCCTSCGELARNRGWRQARCESNGNGACGGRGEATWDCDTCCRTL